MKKKAPTRKATRAKKRPIRIRVPSSLHPILVTATARKKRPRRKPTDRHIAQPQGGGYIFPTVNPSSVVVVRGGISICKYTVPADANANDSVSFQGGPKITSITLVPIFVGSSWLTSSPSNLDVMNAIQTVMLSPYRSKNGLESTGSALF